MEKEIIVILAKMQLDQYRHIEEKLKRFLKKYYTNQLIKGGILFAAFGLIYFLLVLAIEYFMWLKPGARTFLFWCFVLVELGLLVKFIVWPLLQLFGLRRDINKTEAAVLIGNHFSEINDKLTNLIQLGQGASQSDLILASIEQKSKQLNPIPFNQAINFKTNGKFLKYLAIPLFFVLLITFSGEQINFKQSLNRVVNHQTAYIPPAPFTFNILNESLSVEEGVPFILEVEMRGDLVPDQVKIMVNETNYVLQKLDVNRFSFRFSGLKSSQTFYLEANGYQSLPYKLEVINTPKILDFSMQVDYPSYTKRKDELINNTGNLRVPEGTKIDWHLKTQFTNWLTFSSQYLNKDDVDTTLAVDVNEKQLFVYSLKPKRSFKYQISTSNNRLKAYEKLNYQIEVIKDEYPIIRVKSNLDSVKRGPINFVGQVSDDYGLTQLQVVVEGVRTKQIQKVQIPINKTDFDRFFYSFPGKLELTEGEAYHIQFEVFDNDGVNGAKLSKSKTFTYHNKTKEKIKAEQLEDQKSQIDQINQDTKSAEELQNQLDKLSNKLKNQDKQNWQDKKALDNYLKRQKQYKEMLERNTQQLLENLEEMEPEENQGMEEMKKDLKERIQESKELLKNEKLLKELESLTDKLKKEDLLDKLDKLSEQSKQETKTLERILELTKRFYIEKKSKQIAKKLDQLSKEQDSLAHTNQENATAQNKLNKKMDSISKEFDELRKMNQELKKAMPLPDSKSDEDLIKMEMKEASKALEKPADDQKKQTKKATKKQQSAAKKMKELQKKMDGAMQQMQMETLNENIDNLKQILKNLLLFSEEQEEVMLSFDKVDGDKADYPAKLKRQQVLKEHFEHIDDSLYTLSLRLVKVSSKIQKDITNAQYNLDKSLENIAENRIQRGISNQRYTMTAANNLAAMLSDLLQSLQNQQSGGSGKGQNSEEIQLPDIIKQQKNLMQKMQQGSDPKQQGDQLGKEQMSGKQFEIYKEQNALRQSLQELLKQSNQEKGSGSKVVKQMEDLEKMLLEKGINQQSRERMQKLEYELLKLDDALKQQKSDNKRKSTTGEEENNLSIEDQLKLEQQYFNQQELLQRQELPLQKPYKKKVDYYFKNL